MGQRTVEKVRARITEEEVADNTEAEEEEGREVLACLHNLSIETAGTEEEVAENLEAALGISTHEMEVGTGGPGPFIERN